MATVLVVDDHAAVADGTKTMLEQDHMLVTVAYSAEEALCIATLQSFDLYLFDLYLPKLNGLELAKQVLNTRPNATILIYTGYDIYTHFTMIMESGVKGIIPKTATHEQFKTAIRCALQNEVVLPIWLLKELRHSQGELG